MNIEDLEAIIKNRRVTDILSVPGPMFSHKPKTELVGVCRKYRIPLTSINMVQGSTHRQDAVYDLVGAERG